MTQMHADMGRKPVAEGRDPLSFAVIGAAIEVHQHLGHGFLEAVYHQALEQEFRLRSIPAEREASLPVLYKGQPLGCAYKADFLCFDRQLLVELKAIRELGPVEEAQVLNYLKATGIERALLLNFGAPRLDFKRMVLSHR